MMTTAQYHRLGVRVDATPRQVIAAASRMLKPEARLSRAHRGPRHDFYRGALELHHNAGQLYLAVMSGNFGEKNDA